MRAPALLAVAALGVAAPAATQTPTMPSTLRYGSGLIDIPVASVLEHAQVSATFSGFFLSLTRRDAIDDAGAPLAPTGPGPDQFFSDASLTVGLFDRLETGISLQAFGDQASGGDVWGLFGRIRLWEPVDQGLGLAVGARYLTSPYFGDGRDYEPGRLGFADDRLLASYTGRDGASTGLSLYGVATAFLRGFDGGPLPPNDMTFTVGRGSGMFGGPGGLRFYSYGQSNGWFVGSAIHMDTSERSMLTVMAEHNGFDVNLGLQYDLDGFRVGVEWLASNHARPTGGHTSEYTKPKVGLLASVALCPGRRGLRCRPRPMERFEPDTIFVPPPPPDTVIVTVGAPPAVEGVEQTLCLSTGRDVTVRLTADGDTLVAPAWVSLRSAGPNVELTGAYAGGTFWYESGFPIEFEGLTYGRSVDTFPVDCGQILRVGVHEGVPLFAVVDARRPLSVLFVPVRPGVWRRYERGLGPP